MSAWKQAKNEIFECRFPVFKWPEFLMSKTLRHSK